MQQGFQKNLRTLFDLFYPNHKSLENDHSKQSSADNQSQQNQQNHINSSDKIKNMKQACIKHPYQKILQNENRLVSTSSSKQVNNQSKIKKYTQKVPYQQKSFALYIINSLLFLFFLFFLVDLYFEIQKELTQKQNQIQNCYEEYLSNNCAEPIEALVQKCKMYGQCSKLDPKNQIRYTKVMINTLFSLFSIMVNHLGLTGAGILGVLLLVYFLKPRTYIQSSIQKYD